MGVVGSFCWRTAPRRSGVSSLKIESVEEPWCRRFSEPSAGSDVANVSRRSLLDSDRWVMNGREGRDDARAPRAGVPLCHPHRPGVRGPPGPLVPPHPDGPASASRCGGVQQDIFRRGWHRGWPVAWASRRELDGRDGHARLRAVHRVPCQQLAFQRELGELIEVAQPDGAAEDPQVRHPAGDLDGPSRHRSRLTTRRSTTPPRPEPRACIARPAPSQSDSRSSAVPSLDGNSGPHQKRAEWRDGTATSDGCNRQMVWSIRNPVLKPARGCTSAMAAAGQGLVVWGFAVVPLGSHPTVRRMRPPATTRTRSPSL
jgi:hypothetical protein